MDAKMGFMNASQKKSPWRVMTGLFKGLVGLAFLWPGAVSFMVGVTYYQQKGSWAPSLTGMILLLLGFVILVKGVRQILKNTTEMYDDDENL